MIYLAWSAEENGYRPFNSDTGERHRLTDCNDSGGSYSSGSGSSNNRTASQYSVMDKPPPRPNLNTNMNSDGGVTTLLQKSIEAVNSKLDSQDKKLTEVLELVQAVVKTQGMFKTAADLHSKPITDSDTIIAPSTNDVPATTDQQSESL